MWMRNLYILILIKTRMYRHWLRYGVTIVAIVGMCLFGAIFLKETYSKSQLPSSKLLNDSQFFNLLNSTYGKHRILISILRIITPDMIHHHTETALAVPAELSETNLDTGKWSVQKGDLHPYSCHHLLAESVFHSGATDLSRSANAKVLLIGLGGGIVNGFLHFHFPKMDITVVEISSKMVYIARKWYSLEFDDHHRVVIKDGVKFVEGEARKGVKYDAVLVDVCDSSPLLIQPIICPIRTFLGEAFIRNTAKMISTEGVAAFNILTKTLTSEEVSDLLTPHFSNYFNYCNIKDTGIGNMIFYCMLKRPLKEKNINVLEFVKNTPL